MAFNLEIFRTVLGIIGNVISFGLFISPAPTFRTILKRKDVEQFSPNPYLATILNCAMWVFYGLPIVHPNSTLVWTINGIGLAIEFTYITIYLLNANNKKRLYVFAVLGGELVFMTAVVALTLTLAHTTERRSMVVGILCVVFNICMYAMPLDVVRLVITTKSVEYMPFWLLLANFCNGLIWVFYAQIHFDLYMTISNGSGAVLGLMQLIIYFIYRKSTPKRDDKKPPQQLAEVQLSNNDGRVMPAV